MAFNLTRMTAYALVGALEEDLRTLIKQHLNESQDNIKLNPELIKRARLRIEKDIGVLFSDLNTSDLVDYFDIGDTFQTINANFPQFPEGICAHIKSYTKALEKIVPLRNRVMHIRPLNIDDLPSLAQLCDQLTQSDVNIWGKTEEVIRKLKDNPGFVLSLEIKPLDNESSISHNLPLPDFDETGLIGRDDEVKKIKQLCYGSFPVVSIVGEGGIGKTALALKVAYELLEDDSSHFDAIIWVTSKTTQITVNEIKDIKGAINNSLGTIQEISNQLVGSTTNTLNFDEISEYLATFKIALFIDNLETILDENIRNFVGSLPAGSKIIITSRIGLGAFEYPIKLKGIDESYASQLLRTLARLRGVEALSRLDESLLRIYVNRMHRNPSYIKWFVSCVQTGRTPEVVLQNSDLFLEFCMSNVYEYLSEDARLLTAALQCAPGLKDIPELSYLTDFDSLRVQKAIQELMSTNMLSQASKAKGASVKTTYELSELSRAYLGKHHKPPQSFQRTIREKRNKLNALFESQRTHRAGNKYSIKNIKFRDKSDRVVARMLQDALRHIDNDKHDLAYEILQEAHRLSPDYSEVARVMAYFYQKSGNLTDARSNYELALVLDPTSSQLHYWFGRFLIREEENGDEAVEQFERAHELDAESIEVSLALARGYLFQHDFEGTRKILDLLKGSITESEEHHYKVYLDTDIQIHYRTADDLCISSSFTEALEHFERMKESFEALPVQHKDLYLRKKLNKCIVSLSKIIKQGSSVEAMKAQELQAWVNQESR